MQEREAPHPRPRQRVCHRKVQQKCYRLPPWHGNLNLRWIKTPKLHFVDSGLACALLGIREREQLATHPLRGAIFETWAGSEILKQRLNHGRSADTLFYLRQIRDLELDALIDDGGQLTGVEVKSAATVSAAQYGNLLRFREHTASQPSRYRTPPDLRLIHGGKRASMRQGVAVIPWNAIDQHEW